LDEKAWSEKTGMRQGWSLSSFVGKEATVHEQHQQVSDRCAVRSKLAG
jgi:hypothetical protein